MKNKLFKFLCPAAVLLSLTACTGMKPNSKPKDEAVEAHSKLASMDEEEAAAIKEEIKIVGEDAIYGNVYLPTEYDGATIFWRSSNPDMVSYEDDGNLKAGIVTRGEEDTKVTMKAYIEKDGKGAVMEQEINVLAAPAELTDDDFEGYMFAHFIGENGHGQAGEQMYFALAEDGFKFNDINYKNGSLQPVLTSTVGEKGVRDPYICRSHEGDKFFMLATDLSIYNRGGWGTSAGQNASKEGSYNLIKWESTDLVNWSEPEEIKVAPENAGMAWAPEMVYCEETGEYVIISSSSIVNENRSAKTLPDHIYYVTTRDFKHFSESKPFLLGQPKNPSTLEYSDDGKADMSDRRLIIDASVLRVGDYYYCAAKDGDNNEANGNIRLFRSETLFDWRSWEYVTDLDELGIAPNNSRDGIGKFDNSQLEGPELFRFNKKDWASEDTPEYGIMADRYMRQDLGYLPFKTTDFEDRKNENGSWSILDKSQYAFQGGTYRHGSVMNITAAEMERLKEAYPAKN